MTRFWSGSRRAWWGRQRGEGSAVGKIKAGLGAAGAVLCVAEWLMVSHWVNWLMAGVVPH